MRRIVSEHITPGEVTFAEKHPWLVLPVNAPVNFVARRFSNEYCAAQSVWCKGQKARYWKIQHAVTKTTFNFIDCFEMVRINERNDDRDGDEGFQRRPHHHAAID